MANVRRHDSTDLSFMSDEDDENDDIENSAVEEKQSQLDSIENLRDREDNNNNTKSSEVNELPDTQLMPAMLAEDSFGNLTDSEEYFNDAEEIISQAVQGDTQIMVNVAIENLDKEFDATTEDISNNDKKDEDKVVEDYETQIIVNDVVDESFQSSGEDLTIQELSSIIEEEKKSPVRAEKRKSSTSSDDEPISKKLRNKFKVYVDVEKGLKSLETIISQLKGEVVEYVSDANVHVTESTDDVTVQMLGSISNGSPIVPKKFIMESKKAGEWKDPNDYVFKHLKKSIEKSQKKKLFEGFSVVICDNLYYDRDDVKELVKIAGGTIIRAKGIPDPKNPNVVIIFREGSPIAIERIMGKYSKNFNVALIYDKDLKNIVMNQRISDSVRKGLYFE